MCCLVLIAPFSVVESVAPIPSWYLPPCVCIPVSVACHENAVSSPSSAPAVLARALLGTPPLIGSFCQITMGAGDCLIGYLPLAHIFEMICEINCLAGGPTLISDPLMICRQGTHGLASYS